MSLLAERRWTYAEYLALDRDGEQKHEFVDGHVWAMSGGTPTHAQLTANVIGALGLRLRGGPCRVYSSDLRIRVPETGMASYADATVVCGPLESHPEDDDAAANPRVIIEVLSPSTEAWDRGRKFEHYRRLPSLAHYVLVAQDRVSVEHFARNEDGSWTLRAYDVGGVLDLGIATVPVAEIYADVDLA